MKKYFEDCTIAVIFMSVCCGIAAVMGLVDRDKKHKRRPFPPTRIYIYTAEWIRRITKAATAPFRRRHDHLIRFENGVHRLSPEMMAALEAAPHYTMSELEKACNCNSSPEITEQNLETIMI